MQLESNSAEDARVNTLWRALDPKGKENLDLADLKEGLRKIDHPLKNADALLRDILNTIDTNHDGKISYSEFRRFVRQTDKKLLDLFQSIDRNSDGTLQKDELQTAFRRAGLTVSNRKLDDFFSKVDANHDGSVSFDEWRNFLLFLPTPTPDLQTILSYYSTTLRLNHEGDVHISDETSEGIGTRRRFLNLFFGSIASIADPPAPHQAPESNLPQALEEAILDAQDRDIPLSAVLVPLVTAAEHEVLPSTDWTQLENLKLQLMACIPSPGYFVSGGIAGVISRTSTAPLDRLKVYLIAQTKASRTSLSAVASHSPFRAVQLGWMRSVDAMKELWAAGGIRSLFAGNGINVVKVMPESSIKFGFYEATKRVCARLEGHNNPRTISEASKFLSGGVSGMASQFAVYPLDTLKFRTQCETVPGGLYGNQLIFATAKKMWAREGFRAFYKGLPAGMVGIFPYAAIDLGTFEYLKNKLIERKVRMLGCHEEDAAPHSAMTAAIGGFSGALGATVVYPINLVRTRLQSQGTAMHPRTYNGIWDVTRQTIKGEGFNGLFKGLGPNLLKVIPAVSITYVVYEKAKRSWGLL